MEHRIILGGEAYLPFARSRVRALKALGLPYVDQSFEVDGVSIKVRIEPGHEYIRIGGSVKVDMWCLSKEFVGGTPMLCVYSLKSQSLTAKKMAMFPLLPGSASSSAEATKGDTTAWVANGIVGHYTSRSTSGSPSTVTLEFLTKDYYDNEYYKTTTPTINGGLQTDITSTFGPSFSTTSASVVVRHTGAEPTFSSFPGQYADYIHTISNYAGVQTNSPSFSYYCGALSTQTYTYPPTTHSLGDIPYGHGPTYTLGMGQGTAPYIGGTAPGALNIARQAYGVTPGAILTETQPGTINPDIWFGKGKGGVTYPEFSYGYYVTDSLSSINPVTNKYVLRMFKDYYFAFENDLGRRMAKAYTYAGALIEAAPVIYAPDYPVWNDRLMPPEVQNPLAIASARKENRRWMNVGKNSTVYEWLRNDDVAMFGAVAHGNYYMQTIKTQAQIFGALDLVPRASHDWFVPVRPYVVGPDIASMTPYTS